MRVKHDLQDQMVLGCRQSVFRVGQRKDLLSLRNMVTHAFLGIVCPAAYISQLCSPLSA